MRKRRNGDDTHIRYQQIGEVEQDFQFLLPSRPRDIDLPHSFRSCSRKSYTTLMAATKCPQQAGGRQGIKSNPTGRKGRKRRITTLSTRSMELVKATSEHPNLRKGRQKRTDARTHARCSSTKQRSSQQGTQWKRKEKEKEKEKKTKDVVKGKSQKLAL